MKKTTNPRLLLGRECLKTLVTELPSTALQEAVGGKTLRAEFIEVDDRNRMLKNA